MMNLLFQDEEAIKRHIKEQNAKKAEAARLRYHRMTEEEKRAYNQRRLIAVVYSGKCGRF